MTGGDGDGDCDASEHMAAVRSSCLVLLRFKVPSELVREFSETQQQIRKQYWFCKR